jgi:hypothetical protein
VINWSAPDNGGSEITEYEIVIRQEDTTYSIQLSNCDGSLSSVVTSNQCTVPISVFIDSPFSLSWGESVYAKVTAINLYGSSLQSLEGNGAVIVTEPDAPLQVINNAAITTAS